MRDSDFRKYILEHDRDGDVCLKWDDLADKDFSHYMTEAEYFRYKQNWWISLKKFGDQGPLRKRSDFNEALSAVNRLHQEAGGQQLRPMPYWNYKQTNNGSRHRVLPLPGGTGKIPGGLPKNSKKVDERGCMQRFMIERSNPLCSIFG